MIDAPVSGGEPKAIDGTLSIMVGGDEAVFNEVKDILAEMGSSVVYCGDIGAGNTTKLANQVIVALNIAAVSEAFMLSTRAGDLHIKDLNNALETGHSVGAPMPLSAAVMEILQTLRADGCGQDDHSAIAKYYEKLAGSVIRK